MLRRGKGLRPANDQRDVQAAFINQSLAAHVPGLSFESAWGGANSFPVLRGQSQPSIAGDNVGMFVDGVYQGPIEIQQLLSCAAREDDVSHWV